MTLRVFLPASEGAKKGNNLFLVPGIPELRKLIQNLYNSNLGESVRKFVCFLNDVEDQDGM